MLFGQSCDFLLVPMAHKGTVPRTASARLPSDAGAVSFGSRYEETETEAAYAASGAKAFSSPTLRAANSILPRVMALLI